MAAPTAALTDTELELIDAYWRAANYLSVGQIYLLDNPLLEEALKLEHVKPRLLGHWGTTPGLNLLYVHLNRVIRARDLDCMYVIGPGHGGPGIVAYGWLEGTYTEVYRRISRDGEGLRRLAADRGEASGEIARIKWRGRGESFTGGPRWPLGVLRTPEGWTGRKAVDGVQVEGTYRAHQVPVTDLEKPGHLGILERWMRSYRPAELFTAAGALRPELAALAPAGEKRMSANPHANGGLLLKDLDLPDFREYGVKVVTARSKSEATRVLGGFLRDVVKRNP